MIFHDRVRVAPCSVIRAAEGVRVGDDFEVRTPLEYGTLFDDCASDEVGIVGLDDSVVRSCGAANEKADILKSAFQAGRLMTLLVIAPKRDHIYEKIEPTGV